MLGIYSYYSITKYAARICPSVYYVSGNVYWIRINYGTSVATKYIAWKCVILTLNETDV